MTIDEAAKFLLDSLYRQRADLWCAGTPAGKAATEQGIIAYRPALWWGRTLTAPQSRKFSAAVKLLERRGHLEQIRGERRLVAVKLLGVVVLT